MADDSKIIGFLQWLQNVAKSLLPIQTRLVYGPGEYDARLREHVAASDPALVSRVHAAERKLGLTFRGGPYTPYETRAAVMDHLLDPANPQFHTEDVEHGLRNYARTRGFNYDGWPHPSSAVFQNPLRRGPRLLVDNISGASPRTGGRAGGLGLLRLG